MTDQNFPATKIQIRVYYEDTDFSGIVYHANYLKFFERGRSEGLREAGIHHSELMHADPPIAFAVRHMDIDFIRPATIDDILTVTSQVTKLRGARIIFDQTLTRKNAAGVDEILVTAKVEAACITMPKDGMSKPHRMSKEMIAKFTAIQP